MSVSELPPQRPGLATAPVLHVDGTAAVAFVLGETTVELPTDGAREFAYMVLESAEIAEVEALLVRWLGEQGDPAGAVNIVRTFSTWRSEQ